MKFVTEIDRLLVPGKSMRLFSVQDHSAGTYVLDLDCWTYGAIDTSCAAVAVYRQGSPPSLSDTRYGGILVTPRHALMCRHVWGSGSLSSYILRFVTQRRQDGGAETVYDIPIESSEPGTLPPAETPTYYGPGFGDYVVCRLAEDVPADIVPAAVFTGDVFSFVRGTAIKDGSLVVGRRFATTVPVLIVQVDQGQAEYPRFVTAYNLPGQYHTTIPYGKSGGEEIWPNYEYSCPTVPPRSTYSQAIAGGDSGSGIFLIDGTQPLLLSAALGLTERDGVMHLVGGNDFRFVADRVDYLIDLLGPSKPGGGSYTLTRVDLRDKHLLLGV